MQRVCEYVEFLSRESEFNHVCACKLFKWHLCVIQERELRNIGYKKRIDKNIIYFQRCPKLEKKNPLFTELSIRKQRKKKYYFFVSSLFSVLILCILVFVLFYKISFYCSQILRMTNRWIGLVGWVGFVNKCAKLYIHIKTLNASGSV